MRKTNPRGFRLPPPRFHLTRSLLTNGDVAEGSQAGLFSFGKDTDNGLRGIYRSPSGGPVPVVASNSFLRTSGARVGDALIVELKGRFVPIHVRDSVDFFPTLDPRGAGFLLADLETLIHHINILSPALVATPNEMFSWEGIRRG